MRQPIDRTLLPFGFGSARFVLLGALLAAVPVHASADGDSGSPGPLNPAFVAWLDNMRTNGGPAGECAVVPSPIALPERRVESTHASSLEESGEYPARYDSRSLGFTLPVRDQGSDGTCWAHSGLAALEWNILKSEGRVVDFSENNIANRHGFDYQGWSLGNGDMVAAYFLRWDGPILEHYDPYPNKGNSVQMPPARHIQKVCWIPAKTDSLDNDGIKRAVMKYGAVQVAYYDNKGSAYYNSATASYYYPDSHETSHLVAIVGWDDDYSRDNFSRKPAGNGAYIVRNSWGAGWGQGGHFYVSYYDATFGRGRMYAYEGCEYPDNYADVYQYDTYGCTGNWGWSNRNDGWGANIFTARADDSIAAVGFYAFSEGSTYEIRIYTGCNSSNPTRGTLSLTQTGELEEAGYSTIELDHLVNVQEGQRFSVVLHITSPGVDYPLALEWRTEGYTGNVTANAGESFRSSNGTSWYDFTDGDRVCSFCMKAYTKSAGRRMTQSEQTKMPCAWLDDYPKILNDRCSGDYEAAALAQGMNGRSLYDSYVAKLDPESENSDLRASIGFDERDDVVIDYSPKWSDRRYEVLGKVRLSDDEEWEPADSSHRFFRVKVELP